MHQRTVKLITTVLLACLALGLAGADALKWKPLPFANPGTRRLLKAGQSSVYFYRSLPEKSMTADVAGLTAIEIRAISKKPVSKPSFILKYADKRHFYDLELFAVSEKYQVYKPIKLTLPPGLNKLELICYDRDIYFRVFQPVQAKPKPAKLPPLKILGSAGTYELANNEHKNQYYAFRDDSFFSFQVNRGRRFALYVRAQLASMDAPAFAVFADGKKLREVTLSTKRSDTYKAEGLMNLTIGKKLEFAPENKPVKYELRPLTDNLFIARPVILKTK